MNRGTTGPSHAPPAPPPPRLNAPGPITIEAVVHLALASRIGQELAPVTEEAARGDPIDEAGHPGASFTSPPITLHLEHLALPLAELLDDDAGEGVGEIEDRKSVV